MTVSRWPHTVQRHFLRMSRARPPCSCGVISLGVVYPAVSSLTLRTS